MEYDVKGNVDEVVGRLGGGVGVVGMRKLDGKEYMEEGYGEGEGMLGEREEEEVGRKVG